MAGGARDLLRQVGDLVVALALAPLLGAVGVVDGHADDRDRVIDAGDRPDDARDAPPGADDHLAVDLLAQDAVGGADVVLALGRDGRGLQAEAASFIARAASWTISLPVSRRFSSERS